MKETKYTYSKEINFSNHKTGLYEVDTFVKDWGNEPRRGISEKRCRIVTLKGEKVLQIVIPKGSISDGGSFWRLPLPKGLEDVTFEYEVMFGKNFNFVRGGKLPGLGGGTSPGGGSTDKNGFSARLMWRVVNFHDKHLIKDPYKAYLVQYTYYPDKQTRKWGKDWVYTYKKRKIFVRPNKWYAIKMNIKLAKDPNRKDTVIAWVNDKKVLNKKLNLRTTTNYAIDEVMFSLFFGGNEPSWATKKNEKIYFKKFLINGK